MRKYMLAAAVIAAPLHPAVAQLTLVEDPGEIAQDAARDLKDSRFYNKPGATRAQYNTDWQECRLIARGSRTPGGTVPFYYNPAVISPLAAGIGGGIGGLIAGAIQEGEQRRANRRACLMIRGWRLVETPAADAERIAAMSDEERSAYFDTIVGAETVKGEVTARTSFTLASDANLKLDEPVATPGTLLFGEKAVPVEEGVLAEGEAVIVFAFRRPDEGSAGRSGSFELARYDPAGKDRVYRPKDWRKKGDKTTYQLLHRSKDRKQPLEVHVVRVTAGDYVIGGTSVGAIPITTSYCFGAPSFSVKAGEVAYIGDFVPYMDARRSDGSRLTGLAYTSHIEDSRKTLAAKQSPLSDRLQPATLHNGATFACAAVTMDRWDLPGLDQPEPEAPALIAEEAPPTATETAAATVG